ncbi:hypothetical protein Tsubulata_018944 [Turnera subulata]|uniref:Uncharacterized protein n=1 Tax=Turnera subulata TaxID=218843 RepID=A0A9Q0J8L0_9ROSI|nr:hypothetical protein Tsubulata_018944 [Turnera subulata]
MPLNPQAIFSFTVCMCGNGGNECATGGGISWVMPDSVENWFVQWAEASGSSHSRSSWITIGFGMIWSIWLARNNLIFNNKMIDEDEVVDIAIARAMWWFISNNPKFPYNTAAVMVSAECFKDCYAAFISSGCYSPLSSTLSSQLFAGNGEFSRYDEEDSPPAESIRFPTLVPALLEAEIQELVVGKGKSAT